MPDLEDLILARARRILVLVDTLSPALPPLHSMVTFPLTYLAAAAALGGELFLAFSGVASPSSDASSSRQDKSEAALIGDDGESSLVGEAASAAVTTDAAREISADTIVFTHQSLPFGYRREQAGKEEKATGTPFPAKNICGIKTSQVASLR